MSRERLLIRARRLREALRSRLVATTHAPRPDELPRSRIAVWARLMVHAVAIVVLVKTARETFRPLFIVPQPAPVAVTSPGVGAPGIAFELDEKTRKEIFAELASAELAERKRAIAQNTWSGHLWSREDDRGWQERVLARAIAQRRTISLTQVYLVLDEGIRNKWPASDGKPLPATAPPVELRHE